MDDRLRSLAMQAFVQLSLPAYLTLELLLAHVERIRGRRLVIMETSKLTGKKICGLWIPRDDVDVVYHSATHGPLHRQQMILHEISHMILRHDELPDATWQGIKVFQQISGEVVSKALARGDFRSDLEATAEYLADLLAAALRTSSAEILNYEDYFE
ncbi:hypothetical protein FQ377_13850 [Arthrobacter echini]|uniref:ImmA/IrrE family metallo-endopeptidase n=1 Tax=Arthrobacter echini TaxID=1529066 RepID=A0A5D0XJ67_9MICC|nr:hypothetical protein [Arthrobacter echini]TYC96604.1 hypothetical protein FQ377_13850 [Arthrobacter echini]